jgi:branched-chain amino acid transport system substrate-binding protein
MSIGIGGFWITVGTSNDSASASSSPIIIGITVPETGPLAGQEAGTVTGAQVRIDQINAAGGINGRHLKLIEADDQTSPAGALTAVQGLVSKGAVGIVDTDSMTTGAAQQYLDQQGIPLTENSAAPSSVSDPDLFSPLGSSGPGIAPSASLGTFLSKYGVSTIAGVAWGSIPTSAAILQAQLASANKGGVKTVLTDLSPAPTTVDYTPAALMIKQAGAESIATAMTNSANIALASALQTQGVHLKAAVYATTLYDQSVLTNHVLQGAYTQLWFAPSQLQTPAVKTYVAAVNKYAPKTFAGYYLTYGYALTDVLVQGLLRAHGSVTASSLLTGLRKVTHFTAMGLAPKPIDFAVPKSASQNHETCFYYARLTNQKFVPADTSPIC